MYVPYRADAGQGKNTTIHSDIGMTRVCQNATGEIFREHTKKSQADFDEQLKLCPKKFKSNLKSMLGVTTVDFFWFTVRWATLQQLLVKTKVQGL